MTQLDFFGHWFYASLFFGMLLLHAKDYHGWIFRFAGELGWIGIGLILGMTSIWMWGIAFLIVDMLGYVRWKKDHELDEEIREWTEAATASTEDLFPEVGGPDCTGTEHQPFCREYKNRPIPPAILANALQDVVHKDTGKFRPARSVKARANGKNKTVKRKKQGKKVAAKRSRTPNRKVRARRGRSSK